MMEEDGPAFMSLAVREAGKSLGNAVAELREAADFLRYYAAEVREHFRNDTHRAARRRRVHQPVELSAFDLHRSGERGARGR